MNNYKILIIVTIIALTIILPSLFNFNILDIINTNLDKIITIKKQKFNLHWFSIWKRCLIKKWDIIIDFRSSLLSYILFHRNKFIFKPSNDKHQINQLSNFFNIAKIFYRLFFNYFFCYTYYIFSWI